MKKITQKVVLLMSVFVLGLTGILTVRSVLADTTSGQSVSVVGVNYDQMELTIKGNGDQSFYYSDAKQKNWDKITGEVASNNEIKMDISWVTVSKDYVISLKGDVSKNPIQITIPKQNKEFKVTYDKVKNEMSYEGIPSGFSGTVQWKISDAPTWKDVTTSGNDPTLKNKLEYYMNPTKALALQFRLSGVPGNSVSNTGVRPSREVRVSLPKTGTAPSIKINGDTLEVTVPKNVTYGRMGDTNWEPAKATEHKEDLTAMAPGAFAAGTSAKDEILEFRTVANSKTPASDIAYIRINKQKTPDEVGLNATKCTTAFVSNTSVKINIALDNDKTAYEYAITPKDNDAITKDTKWNALSITSTKPAGSTEKVYSITKTLSEDVIKEGKVWVRSKTKGTIGNDDYQLASQAYKVFSGTFPSATSSAASSEITVIKNGTYNNDLIVPYLVGSEISAENAKVELVKINGYSIPASDLVISDLSVTADGQHSGSVTVKANGIVDFLKSSGATVNAASPLKMIIKLKGGTELDSKIAFAVKNATTIEGTKTYNKVIGFDRTVDFTLDFHGKNPSEYFVQFCVNNSTVMDSTVTKTPIENSEKIKYTFSVDDNWLLDTGATPVAIKIFKGADRTSPLEILTGSSITKQAPVTVQSSGSTTFTAGSRNSNMSLTLKINSDSSVMNGFSVTSIKWGDVSLLSGAEVSSSGENVQVVISKDKLNAISVTTMTTNKLKIGVKNHPECDIDYSITIYPSDVVVESSASTAAVGMAVTNRMARNRSLKKEGNTDNGATVSPITLNSLDYNEQILKANLNGNAMGFYSTDKKKWYAMHVDSTDSRLASIDISWVAATKETSIYLKGSEKNEESDYLKVTLPKKNSTIKVTFDKKSDGDAPKLKILNIEGVEQLQWRKYTGTTWKTISASAMVNSEYTEPELEKLRNAGGKIVVRALGKNATDSSNMGMRPSKDVNVSITKRTTAPSAKINTLKLTVNTTDKMEYYNTSTNAWVTCGKNMLIWDIPEVKATVKASSGASVAAGTDVVIRFRKKATTSQGYSKEQICVFQGQKIAPKISEADTADVVYKKAEVKSGKTTKVVRTLTFKKASKTSQYQYVVVSGSFDESTAKWSTVAKNTEIKLNTKAVSGAKIYVRERGVNAVPSKKQEAVLPSAWASYQIP